MITSPSSFPKELAPYKETIHLALLALLSGECELGSAGICYYLSQKLVNELPDPQFIYNWVGSHSVDICLYPQGELTPERITLAKNLISQLEGIK